MNDLYRWTNQSGGAWVDTEEMRKELIDDGVLVPDTRLQAIADIDWREMEKRISRRIHAVSPASLNASQRTQLHLAVFKDMKGTLLDALEGADDE